MGKIKNTSKNKSKDREAYIEDLKKTLTPLIFGILAGVICFSIYVASPRMVVDDTGGTMVASWIRGSSRQIYLLSLKIRASHSMRIRTSQFLSKERING